MIKKIAAVIFALFLLYAIWHSDSSYLGVRVMDYVKGFK